MVTNIHICICTLAHDMQLLLLDLQVLMYMCTRVDSLSHLVILPLTMHPQEWVSLRVILGHRFYLPFIGDAFSAGLACAYICIGHDNTV